MDKGFSGRELQKLEENLFDRINEERKKRKRLPLVWSAELAREARRHSVSMLEGGFFAHNDPVRGGLQKRLTDAGAKVSPASCAENIFMQRSRREPMRRAFDTWLDSDEHRANILNSAYTDTGIGMALSEDGSWFVTQIFASAL